MKVAIMQPYFFPYIGYFNLIAACDMFISLDSVQYINRGFVNRNRIVQQNSIYTFTVPLISSPRNYSINQRMIAPEFEVFKKKFVRQLETAYKKAPFFEETMELIQSVLNSTERNLARICEKTILAVMEKIGLHKKILTASQLQSQSPVNALRGQEQIINLVKLVKGTHYINLMGGVDLYNKDEFLCHSIKLSFIKPLLPFYKQKNKEFIPGLSIMDVLMFNSPQEIFNMTLQYEMLDKG